VSRPRIIGAHIPQQSIESVSRRRRLQVRMSSCVPLVVPQVVPVGWSSKLPHGQRVGGLPPKPVSAPGRGLSGQQPGDAPMGVPAGYQGSCVCQCPLWVSGRFRPGKEPE
jgi:hypothetical protein